MLEKSRGYDREEAVYILCVSSPDCGRVSKLANHAYDHTA